MATQFKQKMIYQHTFEGLEVRPLIDMQEVAEQENIFEMWASHLLLEGKNEIMEKTEPQIIAEAQRGGATGGGAETYTLLYYNPELNRAEVLESNKSIKQPDVAQQMIEESMGLRSTYTLYKFIATPIMRTEIVPWKLEQILNEREYGTPPPTGGAGSVKISPQEVKSQIVAVNPGKKMKEAVVAVMRRKEKTEEELEEQIVALEFVVASIKEGKDVKSSLKKLPPLTRARFMAAIKKLKLDKKIVIKLLMKDLKFLKGIKGKLKKMSIKDLVSLIKTLGKLKKKK